MLISYIRTVILYLLLILVVRVMGKRQIGQMEPTEFVVTMLLANLAAVPMQDNGIPLASGLVPMLTVLGISLILSVLAYQSIRMRRLLCGKPVILVENGTICQRNLARTRIHLDEADRAPAGAGHSGPDDRQIRDSGDQRPDLHLFVPQGRPRHGKGRRNHRQGRIFALYADL